MNTRTTPRPTPEDDDTWRLQLAPRLALEAYLFRGEWTLWLELEGELLPWPDEGRRELN